MLGQYATIQAIRTVTESPRTVFSVRGLARSAGISPSAASTAFRFMHDRNMVSSQAAGRTFQFHADTGNALCRQWKLLFNLEALHRARTVAEITSKTSGTQCVLLYGSMGRGTNDPKSDFDLLVIAATKPAANWKFMQKLPAEANLSVYTPREWTQKARTDRVFYENIIYDAIVLYGERPVVL